MRKNQRHWIRCSKYIKIDWAWNGWRVHSIIDLAAGSTSGVNKRMGINKTTECRLCGSVAKHAYDSKLLRYTVSYFQCSECDYFQTEKPFWLDESMTISPGNNVYGISVLEFDASQSSSGSGLSGTNNSNSALSCEMKTAERLLDWTTGTTLDDWFSYTTTYN